MVLENRFARGQCASKRANSPPSVFSRDCVWRAHTWVRLTQLLDFIPCGGSEEAVDTTQVREMDVEAVMVALTMGTAW